MNIKNTEKPLSKRIFYNQKCESNCECGNIKYPEYFRVVDLRNGKKIDDGYRAVHLYYQRDNLAYPIEIQLWCAKDYQFNIWSHKLVYKYWSAEIGKELYGQYRAGIICTENEFKAEMSKLIQNKVGEYDGNR